MNHRILILRGPQASARVSALQASDGALAFRWDVDPQDAPSWAGLRSLFDQAHAALGESAFAKAIAPHRGLLSLLLRRLEPEFTPEERQERDSLRGLRAGFLPNAVIRRRPLVLAWCRALAAILDGRHVQWVIPDLSRVDLDSLSLVRPLLSHLRGRADITVLIGDDPTQAPASSLDRLLHCRKRQQVALLEALPFARVESCGGAVETLREAFDCLGFEGALRRALTFLETGEGSPDERREANAIAGISALNLDPLARGNDWAVDVMARAFAGALDGESDPDRRAHWHYRLCLVHGRAKGDIEAALDHGDRAVAEAVDPFFQGWARNGRAYALLRAGRAEEAARDCEEGLVRAAEATSVPEVEVRRLRLLISNNRSRLAQARGDREALGRFRRLTHEVLASLPTDDRPGQQWFIPPEDETDLPAARRYYEELLAQAREGLEAEVEAIAAHGLAMVEYRLGDGAAARALWQNALRIWRVIGGYPEDLFAEELNCAVTAFRTGLYDEAEAGFQHLREHPFAQADGPQGEMLGALAMIAARRGDSIDTRGRGEHALEFASKSGDARVLARVLRSIGEADLSLGRRNDALASFRRALSIAESTTLPPEDLLGILVGALDAGDSDSTLVSRALATVPAAVADVNAWWDLPRLLVHVRALLDAQALSTSTPGLDRTLQLAAQRPDCAPLCSERPSVARA